MLCSLRSNCGRKEKVAHDGSRWFCRTNHLSYSLLLKYVVHRDRNIDLGVVGLSVFIIRVFN